jgi:hypothetical protein
LAAPAAAGSDSALLERHRPQLRYDSHERDFARSVPRLDQLGRDPLPPGRPLVYGRVARDARGRAWLQYWMYYAANTQDRGIFHTGRHAGDWELVQIALDSRRRPGAVTFAQHSWATGCAWAQTRHEGPAPVIYVANGSHAVYPQPGTADRPFPDPIDEADGRGRVARPPVAPIDVRNPSWVAWPGRWGASQAGPVPGEQSSPRGPAFQGVRWSDPARFQAGARPCGAGAPGRPWQTALTAALVAAALAAGVAVLLRRRAYNRGP